jgi:hypothetical protein
MSQASVGKRYPVIRQVEHRQKLNIKPNKGQTET